jgi:hypothetical protein
MKSDREKKVEAEPRKMTMAEDYEAHYWIRRVGVCVDSKRTRLKGQDALWTGAKRP